MFGYIRPNKMELKLKDIHRYNDLYCGLCQAIRSDYGQLYGCALSYDLTFLLAVLNGLSDDKCKRVFRCPLHPFKEKSVCVSESALHYTAFINYFLMYLKISDDVVDDKSILKGLLQRFLGNNKKYQIQYVAYAETARELKRKMSLFNELETTTWDFDELSNSFGDFFAEIFLGFCRENGKNKNWEQLQKLCFYLGKWIYIIDAYDDYLDDMKKGKFNLLKTMCFETENPSMEQIHQRVQGVIGFLLGGMKRNLRTIVLEEDYAIVENIIEYGCNAQYTRIVKKRYPEYFASNNSSCNCH